MRLESVRELKQALYEPLRVRSGLSPQEAADVSVPAERTTDVPRIQPSLALGVVPGSRDDFRLAVRVQRRDLLASERLQAIHRAAHGEVDVQYVGQVGRLAASKPARVRPIRPGLSVGHYTITAGTIGALVHVRKDSLPRLLSNNHVLADENRGHVGDDILQPGKIDGGTRDQDRIGGLERFCDLSAVDINYIDAALATLDEPSNVDPFVPDIGRVTGVTPPEEVTGVAKLGRTTALTRGTVTAIEVDNVVVGFSTGSLRFDGQMEVSGRGDVPFSQPGDSGSLVVAAGDPQAVGLVFAGSDQGGPNGVGLTYANPIASVFARLDIQGLW